MTNKPMSKAIEFKLRQLGKFEGADVQTREVSDEKSVRYELTVWNVPGVERPDDSTLQSWISEEEAAHTTKETQRATKINALNSKIATSLGVNSLDEFKELLK